MNPTALDPTNTVFTLKAGTTNITNVRVWKESMEEEKQPVTLNQYVVRDNDIALLIDNAIPPLRMVKEYVR
jgi:flavorubredoxin